MAEGQNVLDPQRVAAALEEKRGSFHAYAQRAVEQRAAMQEWLEGFFELDSVAIETLLAEQGHEWPGAWPTPELDRAARLRLPFDRRWTDHQDARAWALSVLQGRPTLAVDGSQITPDPALSIPVGATQIGWFVNDHQPDGSYTKDLQFAILAPEDLGEADGDGEEGFAVQTINQTRFVAECNKLAELMHHHAAAPARPLCFFDGSFIISFAGKIRPERAQRYVDAIAELLAASAATQVPLVGFVDNSLSHDIVTMISHVAGRNVDSVLTDAMLLAPLLPNWGDRSPCFICARPDALSAGRPNIFYRDVVFCYVRLSADRPPARVEMPRWMYEANCVDDIIDLVRAECIVGAGYPYAIETADALAVISRPDRQRFYALFEQFVAQEGVYLTQTRKAHSKQVRR